MSGVSRQEAVRKMGSAYETLQLHPFEELRRTTGGWFECPGIFCDFTCNIRFRAPADAARIAAMRYVVVHAPIPCLTATDAPYSTWLLGVAAREPRTDVADAGLRGDYRNVHHVWISKPAAAETGDEEAGAGLLGPRSYSPAPGHPPGPISPAAIQDVPVGCAPPPSASTLDAETRWQGEYVCRTCGQVAVPEPRAGVGRHAQRAFLCHPCAHLWTGSPLGTGVTPLLMVRANAGRLRGRVAFLQYCQGSFFFMDQSFFLTGARGDAFLRKCVWRQNSKAYKRAPRGLRKPPAANAGGRMITDEDGAVYAACQRNPSHTAQGDEAPSPGDPGTMAVDPARAPRPRTRSSRGAHAGTGNGTRKGRGAGKRASPGQSSTTDEPPRARRRDVHARAHPPHRQGSAHTLLLPAAAPEKATWEAPALHTQRPSGPTSAGATAVAAAAAAAAAAVAAVPASQAPCSVAKGRDGHGGRAPAGLSSTGNGRRHSGRGFAPPSQSAAGGAPSRPVAVVEASAGDTIRAALPQRVGVPPHPAPLLSHLAPSSADRRSSPPTSAPPSGSTRPATGRVRPPGQRPAPGVAALAVPRPLERARRSMGPVGSTKHECLPSTPAHPAAGTRLARTTASTRGFDGSPPTPEELAESESTDSEGDGPPVQRATTQAVLAARHQQMLSNSLGPAVADDPVARLQRFLATPSAQFRAWTTRTGHGAPEPSPARLGDRRDVESPAQVGAGDGELRLASQSGAPSTGGRPRVGAAAQGGAEVPSPPAADAPDFENIIGLPFPAAVGINTPARADVGRAAELRRLVEGRAGGRGPGMARGPAHGRAARAHRGRGVAGRVPSPEREPPSPSPVSEGSHHGVDAVGPPIPLRSARLLDELIWGRPTTLERRRGNDWGHAGVQPVTGDALLAAAMPEGLASAALSPMFSSDSLWLEDANAAADEADLGIPSGRRPSGDDSLDFL